MTPLWVLVARKAADTLVRVLDSLFPMVDPGDQARLLAAMEGRDQAPAPGALGEAHPGAGNGPGRKAPSVADLPGHPHDTTPWSPHPSHAWEFT